MKKLAILLPLIFLTNCKPEQAVTEFEVTVKPLAGKSVDSTTKEDTPILISYEVEEDEDIPKLSFQMVEKPQFGELSGCKYTSKTSWECVYKPFLNFNGSDKIAFKTTNGDFSSNDKSYIKINVTPVADAPLAGKNQTITVTENQSITFTVNQASDPDTKASEIAYKIKSAPKDGTLSNCFTPQKPRECTYTPTPDYIGEDSLDYTVADSENKLLSDDKKSKARVDITVLKEWIPVNGVSSIKVEDKKSNALIVFALDTSGSMEPYLEHMKTSVTNFIDDIAKKGFKATLAFITSDQISNRSWTDVYEKTQPHPDYPSVSGSYIRTWTRVPKSSAVKIFEIDAYDFEWNQTTKNKIAQTKTDVLNFISSQNTGSDDERLLCSTIRFLKSDYAKDKNYLGIFSIANEDDSVNAKTVEKAFSDCHNLTVGEKIPEASCQKTISCEEGDPNCNGSWLYTYDKIIKNPYPAEFSGTCEVQVPNMVEKEQNRRVVVKKVVKYKTVYNEVCNDEDIVQEPWRKGQRREIQYRSETKTECSVEWETLDNPSGCKEVTKQVENGFVIKDVDEQGTCDQRPSDERDLWESCTNYIKTIDDGCDNVGTQVADGYRYPSYDQADKCSELTASQRVDLESCTDYTKTVSVQEGTKSEQKACTATGGSSCDDHSKFIAGTCEKTKEAGSNPDTIVKNQQKSSSTKKSCTDVTGFDTCSSIVWKGTKKITSTTECGLQNEKKIYHKFTVKDAATQSLANSVADALKNDFKKSVYINVSHDLSLNNAALKDAANKNMVLPSEACQRYLERREKFKQVVNGITKYVVDGVQFNEVVKLLSSDQASSHSICSPYRYPSDKLDYLVEDAQLEFKIEEADQYENVQVSQVKVIYASGEEKTLSKNEYTYQEGHVKLVDPLTAKNLVELQATYNGFEK